MVLDGDLVYEQGRSLLMFFLSFFFQSSLSVCYYIDSAVVSHRNHKNGHQTRENHLKKHHIFAWIPSKNSSSSNIYFYNMTGFYHQ